MKLKGFTSEFVKYPILARPGPLARAEHLERLVVGLVVCVGGRRPSPARPSDPARRALCVGLDVLDQSRAGVRDVPRGRAGVGMPAPGVPVEPGVLGHGTSCVPAVPVQSHSSTRLNVTASNGAMRTGSSSSTVAMSCHFPSWSLNASRMRSTGSMSHRCTIPADA